MSNGCRYRYKDPNGPMVYNGVYHLFYQYNPQGAGWVKEIVWGHSTLFDLVNWNQRPPIITPSDRGDINGCWSGSTSFLHSGKPAILYTGNNARNHQVQNLAFPKNLSDPFLIEWVKNPNNPVITPTRKNKINATSFRDPTTAWLGPDKQWRIIVGSQHFRTGLAILFRSKNFVNWTQANKPLHSARDIGMWECPDFFPVSIGGKFGLGMHENGIGIKHVLKLSLDETRHDYYTIGTYNVDRDTYIPDKEAVDSDAGLRYDYGKFYASKTFFDGLTKRRILWGWVNESLPDFEYVSQGWSGVQAIPRNILLDKAGKQLIQWPVDEIKKLRTKKVNFSNKMLKGGSILEISQVTAAQADIEISFDGFELSKAEKMEAKSINPKELCNRKGPIATSSIGPFGLKVLASNDHREYTAVYFRIFKDHSNKFVVLMCSDQTMSSLNNHTDKTAYGAYVDVDPSQEPVSLRSLIDHSIVENFAVAGRTCITSRIYPTLALADKAKLFTYNDGSTSVNISSMSAWSMKAAQIN